MLMHKRIQVVDDEERLTKTTEASGPNYLEAQIVDSAGVLYTVPKVTPFGKKSWILDLGTTVYRVHLTMKKMRKVDLAKVKQLVLDVVREPNSTWSLPVATRIVQGSATLADLIEACRTNWQWRE
jgi:hypothetical protein